MTPVKVIGVASDTALVEWHEDGRYYRVFVPANEVLDGQMEHPHWGAPYGEDWAALIQVDVSEIANELRRHGIWTIDDLQARPDAARGVIQSVANRLLSSLISNARALKAQSMRR